jgi:hypothetical protein
MRGSAFIALFGIATAISSQLIGCGDEDETEAQPKPAPVVKSSEGESCLTTNDCDEGLACFSNVCLEAPSSTGGSGGSGPTQTLGGQGESCTRRLDCQPGLGCYNQRCAMSDTGEGGGGNIPPVTLGQRGETCVLSSDCEAGLACRPSGTNSSVGVCTDENTDVAPTGRVCGAECVDPEDCCQIPIELQEPNVKSCGDLAALLDGVTCDNTATAQNQIRCLVNDAYCAGCDANTWDCTAGRCFYNAVCSADGLVPGGCPTFSRTGFSLPPTCDPDMERCLSPEVTPFCEMDADCEGLPVSDDLSMMPDTCNGDECVCFEESRCLRRCDSPLDCRLGYTCDTGDEVCIPEGTCTTDDTCKAVMADIRAVCRMNACTLPCVTDLDCNDAGLIEGGFRQVCASGMCTNLGCNDDSDCGNAMTGVKTFCTEPEAATAARAAQSAITD